MIPKKEDKKTSYEYGLSRLKDAPYQRFLESQKDPGSGLTPDKSPQPEK